MNPPAKSVNAWIFLMEDEPPGTSYKTPGSCYQSLITYGVYKYTDMVSICWVDTVPTSSTTVPQGDGSTYTVELQAKIQPDKSTNLEYMQWLIQDARAVNPNVKVLIMLGYAADEINRIFSPDSGRIKEIESRGPGAIPVSGPRPPWFKAVEYATRARKPGNWKVATNLDTLAAACAKCGRLDGGVNGSSRHSTWLQRRRRPSPAPGVSRTRPADRAGCRNASWGGLLDPPAAGSPWHLVPGPMAAQ
jgi:hypothetical protein